jgi:hypothetical protein
MDCVAKDGQLVMHVISEHVENAGVHSGDATLIQPPQDLDKDTMDKIVIATQKIAQGLRVTGMLPGHQSALLSVVIKQSVITPVSESCLPYARPCP